MPGTWFFSLRAQIPFLYLSICLPVNPISFKGHVNSLYIRPLFLRSECSLYGGSGGGGGGSGRRGVPAAY